MGKIDKKIIIAIVAVIVLIGGYLLTSKVDNAVVTVLTRELEKAGATFDSIDFNSKSNRVEILNLSYNVKHSKQELAFSVSSLTMEGFSLDAIDSLNPSGDDYPLIADSINLKNMRIVTSNSDRNFKIDSKLDNYTLKGWKQNLAKLILASQKGLESKEFIDRALMFEFTELSSTNFDIIMNDNDLIITVAVDNTDTKTSEENIFNTSLNNFKLTAQDSSKEEIGNFSIGSFTGKNIQSIPHDKLSLLVYYLISDDPRLESELLKHTLNNNSSSTVASTAIVENAQLTYEKKQLFTIKEIASFSDMKNRISKYDMKNFIINKEVFDLLSLFIGHVPLDALRLNALDVSLSMETEISEDFKTVDVAIAPTVENLFSSLLTAEIEFRNPINKDTPTNHGHIDNIEIIHSFALTYKDLGFIPRINLALQNISNIDFISAKNLMLFTVSFANDMHPDILNAIAQLVENTGSISIKTRNALDRKNIENALNNPTSLRLDVEYTQGTPLEDAVNAIPAIKK